jgi:hypothetical protein
MNKSKVAQVIEQGSKLVFRPNPDFYTTTMINRKRWGLIYVGKIEPTISEVDRLSKYFGIPVTNFF